jgi:hypothetical protein
MTELYQTPAAQLVSNKGRRPEGDSLPPLRRGDREGVVAEVQMSRVLEPAQARPRELAPPCAAIIIVQQAKRLHRIVLPPRCRLRRRTPAVTGTPCIDKSRRARPRGRGAPTEI